MRAFLVGLLLGSVAPAAAQEVEFRCTPHFLKPCENRLKMLLERGSVPNRCNLT